MTIIIFSWTIPLMNTSISLWMDRWMGWIKLHKSHTNIMKGICWGVGAIVQQSINSGLIFLFTVFLVVRAAGQDVVHDPVASWGRKKRVLIINEEEVDLALVERCSEVVRLWPHDVVWQPERVSEPLQRNFLSFGNITRFKGHFDL